MGVPAGIGTGGAGEGEGGIRYTPVVCSGSQGTYSAVEEVAAGRGPQATRNTTQTARTARRSIPINSTTEPLVGVRRLGYQRPLGAHPVGHDRVRVVRRPRVVLPDPHADAVRAGGESRGVERVVIAGPRLDYAPCVRVGRQNPELVVRRGAVRRPGGKGDQVRLGR